MYLSNGRPFDLFAAFPHCLDNEYWPLEDLPAIVGGVSDDQRRAFRRRRDEVVHREFIRALVYSPQVVVGRQSAVNERALIEAARDYPDVVLNLMNQGRLVLLRMEDSFAGFLEAPPFPVDEMGLAVWQPLVRREGEKAVCSLPLTADQAREVKRRYSTFFRGLHDDDESLRVLFAECSGRELSDLQRPEVSAEFEDFRALVHDDLRPWAAEIPFASFGRTAIYARFVSCTADRATDAEVQRRRERHRVVVRRMADLAYNHNTPVTLGRQSFIPPKAPDPTCLPSHLYRPAAVLDVAAQARVAAGQQALSTMLDVRGSVGQHFFYRMQEEMRLPDIGSFTIKDVQDLHGWDEWRAFNDAQNEAMKFADADDLLRRLAALFEATTVLHRRFEKEMKGRAWWRPAARGTVKLCVSAAAILGCEAMVPPHLASQVIADAMIAAMVTTKMEACIDVCIHGVVEAGRIVRELGGRRTLSRQLELTDRDRAQLERLLRSAPVTEELRAQDDAIRDTEQLAKKSLTSS